MLCALLSVYYIILRQEDLLAMCLEFLQRVSTKQNKVSPDTVDMSLYSAIDHH